MAWRQVGKPRSVKLTRELARKYADMNRVPKDRQIDERRMEEYRRFLLEGTLRSLHWATAFCLRTQSTYRVDGKHTSTLMASVPELPDLWVVLEDFEADELLDVARLHVTFDSKLQVRTSNETTEAIIATHDLLRDLARTTMALLAAGIAFEQHGREVYHRTLAKDRAEEVLKYPEFSLWVDQLFNGSRKAENGDRINSGSSRHLRKQAVVAAMFACYKVSPVAATVFWVAVRDETGASPDLPDRKLARLLRETAIDTGRTSILRSISSRMLLGKSIRAWNAWRGGKPTDLKYNPEKDIPPAV